MPEEQYALRWSREFAHPIYALECGDFNQDGVDELVVNTLHGVHILQPDLEAAADKVMLSVAKLQELDSLREHVGGGGEAS